MMQMPSLSFRSHLNLQGWQVESALFVEILERQSADHHNAIFAAMFQSVAAIQN